MTVRTRTTVLAILGAGWVVLGVVNMAKHRTGVGTLYLIIGGVLAFLALVAKRGPRAR